MKKQLILAIILGTILSTDCAYYNIFFNARRYYNKGYEATQKNRTEKATSTETTNYKKAIEKSATLIQEYPDSKWVDDAIMLMGKAYYYQQSYLMAERKFYELITHYPESEYVFEARLWQAKTKVALEEFKEAEIQFAQLLELDLPQKLRGEASMYLGELYEKQELYDQAVVAYLEAVEDGVKEVRADAMFSAAACYDSLHNYIEAAKAYNQVPKYNPSQELKFDSRMKYAQMRKEIGEYDNAIRDFEILLNDQRFVIHAPRIRLEIADCLARKGDISGAIISYQDITKDYEKTNFSGKAYYQLGILYEQNYRDYDRAYDHFKLVKPEASRSAFADSAEMKARDIERLKALTEVIRMGIKGETGALKLDQKEIEKDTMNADILFSRLDSTDVDSAKLSLISVLLGQSFLDSLLEEQNLTDQQKRLPDWQARIQSREERGGIDWLAWFEDDAMPSEDELQQEVSYIEKYRLKAERPDIVNSDALRVFRVEELDKNLIFLAELYWFRFHLPDSAASQYRYIINRMPEGEFTPKALYNYAYLLNDQFADSSASDSLYQLLIERYPDTPYAARARKWLGLPAIQASVDSIEQYFKQAEHQLLAMNDPEGAYRIYENIHRDYPDSRWAPKAFYSMGWILENSLDSKDRALTLYDSLIAWYPETEYAKKVKPKIEVVRNEDQRIALEKERAEAARADSIAKAQELPDLSAQPADSTVSDSTGLKDPGSVAPVDPSMTEEKLEEKTNNRRGARDMERIFDELETSRRAAPDSASSVIDEKAPDESMREKEPVPELPEPAPDTNK
jgi:TolA-binding protein